MKTAFALLTAFSLLGGTAALAGPPAKGKTPAKPSTTKTAKLTEVWTCPVTGEAIKDHKTEAGKPEVVGNYRVHFCCAGCPETFAKKSASEKKQLAVTAAKKDAAKSTSAKKA